MTPQYLLYTLRVLLRDYFVRLILPVLFYAVTFNCRFCKGNDAIWTKGRTDDFLFVHLSLGEGLDGWLGQIKGVLLLYEQLLLLLNAVLNGEDWLHSYRH